MWDRLAATGCIAATLPIAADNKFILLVWAICTVGWLVNDFRRRGRSEMMKPIVELDEVQITKIAEQVTIKLTEKKVTIQS